MSLGPMLVHHSPTMTSRVRRTAVITVLLLLAAAPFARAQSGSNVLLVVNTNSAASQQIAERYARARAVPQDNILRISVETAEQITRPVFEAQIEQPIVKWFNKESAHDRILYIVLTKGVPLRVFGTSG